MHIYLPFPFIFAPPLIIYHTFSVIFVCCPPEAPLFTAVQCDKLRTGELVKVLRDAGQEVPAAMNDFDLSIKRKEHKLYGNFGPKDDGRPMKKATKITFD